METRIPASTGREERRIESFSTPDTFYDVRLYRDESGVVVGGSCSCPARVEPARDKHILLEIAESYGADAPKAGSFVTPDFLEELSELSGIAYWELSDAFAGERKVVAKAVVKAVVKAAVAIERDGDEQSHGRFVRGWSKRHGRGWHHPAMSTFGSEAPEVA